MTDRDRLIELLQEYTDDNNGGGSNHGLADRLLANGVIVPPCKVGDVVYEVNSDTPFDEDLRVMETKIERFFVGTSLDIHSMDCLGKTVFLTKEEAEANLRERKEDEGK